MMKTGKCQCTQQAVRIRVNGAIANLLFRCLYVR